MDSFDVGIDIGTTSVKVVIVSFATKKIRGGASVRHHVEDGENATQFREQKVGQIVSAVASAVHQLRRSNAGSLFKHIRSIGVCGQMHGVVCWDSTDLSNPSDLVTWEDGRCDATFLKDLETHTGHKLSSGFGMATLAWYQQHSPKFLSKYDRCGTIMDYIVCLLTNMSPKRRAEMDFTNAQSFGLYDDEKKGWDLVAIEKLDLAHMLPILRPAGETVGRLSSTWSKRIGIASSVPVTVASGDSAAVTLMAIDNDATDICLSFGTSSQLSAVMTASERSIQSEDTERRPFYDGRVSLVAASMNGGNVIEETARGLLRICSAFSARPPSFETARALLNELGMKERLRQSHMLENRDSIGTVIGAKSVLGIDPRFNGERSDPGARGAITGISGRRSFDAGLIWYETLKGLLMNLKSMMPDAIFRRRKRVICLGGAFAGSTLLRQCAEDIFRPLEVTFEYSAEFFAAAGAAIVSGKNYAIASKDVILSQDDATCALNFLTEGLHGAEELRTPKENFERKAAERLAVYRKVNRSKHGVAVEKIYGVPSSYLACQIPEMKEEVFPFAGVPSPSSRRKLWVTSGSVDHRQSAGIDMRDLDSAINRAMYIEEALGRGEDPEKVMRAAHLGGVRR
eukprot:g1270.t1